MKKGVSLLGKHLLVGLTYLAKDGKVREQTQLHGMIKSVSKTTIIFDRADGKGSFSIPFDGELERAEPGATYTLKSTGEEVADVDFVASWTIHPPKRGSPVK